MKTRVTEHFDSSLGIYCYRVWKWSLWDVADLRAAYPTTYDWRPVIYLPDRERCVKIAEQLSAPPPSGAPHIRLVDVGYSEPCLVPLIAEFGE